MMVWKEAREHARQHEAQRATATNMILLLASADLGAMATLHLGYRTVPLALALVLLGLFGFLLSAKHYERAERSVAIAVEFERLLDEVDEALKIATSKKTGEQTNARQHPIVSRIRLNQVWSTLHLLVLAVGVATLAFSLAAN